MKVFKLVDFEKLAGCVATIGIFDGVHSAHKLLLEKLHKIAHSQKLPAVVITFWPHPRTVLQPNADILFLTTQLEKYEELKKTGLVDFVIEIPFTDSFSQMSATDFISFILIEKLNIKALLLGYDHHFGKNREGNIRFFDHKIFPFHVFEIEQQNINNITINSSNIRRKIIDGEIENANLLLGRQYSIKGIVVEGHKIGRTLNFATANIDISEKEKLLPNGVFFVQVLIGLQYHHGLLNIGTRPTFDGTKKSVEVHILNFETDIYGQEIELFLIKKIRNEQKFDSIQSLQQQINIDKQYALNLIDTRN